MSHGTTLEQRHRRQPDVTYAVIVIRFEPLDKRDVWLVKAWRSGGAEAAVNETLHAAMDPTDWQVVRVEGPRT